MRALARLVSLSLALSLGTAVLLAQGPISGLTSTPITFSGHADAFVAGPDGNVWLVDQISNVVGRLAVDGSAYQTFLVPTAAAGLNSIALGPEGNLWFTESAASKVGRITTAGTITEFAVPAPFVFSLFGLANGEGTIAVGPDGNLWISGSGQMAKVTVQGTVTVVPVAPPPGSSLFDIGKCVAGPDGNLWCISNVRIAGQGDNHPAKITTAGVATLYPGISSQDFDILKGPDGNLWISANGVSPAHSLMRITPAGVETVYALPTSRESRLAVGADGNIWFTERTTMGNLWQMILSSATDDGHATFHSAPISASYPEGIVAVTSPAGASGISARAKAAASCPPGVSFYLSNAVSFGENLTWVRSESPETCTDLVASGAPVRISPPQLNTSLGLATCQVKPRDPTSGLPNEAVQATLTIEAPFAIAPYANPDWTSCENRGPEIIQCSSASAMQPGQTFTLVYSFTPLRVDTEVVITCVSVTAEMSPADNQLIVDAITGIGRHPSTPADVDHRGP